MSNGPTNIAGGEIGLALHQSMQRMYEAGRQVAMEENQRVLDAVIGPESKQPRVEEPKPEKGNRKQRRAKAAIEAKAQKQLRKLMKHKR